MNCVGTAGVDETTIEVRADTQMTRKVQHMKTKSVRRVTHSATFSQKERRSENNTFFVSNTTQSSFITFSLRT